MPEVCVKVSPTGRRAAVHYQRPRHFTVTYHRFRNYGYFKEPQKDTSLYSWWKMQRLEEHTFANVQQQHSLQAELHESRNLSPKAYSRNLFLLPTSTVLLEEGARPRRAVL
ncbi:hypothetical protein TURU_114458 [Turdus rufiventris]|nr:hypothetical protein TURU_114458 [Turdus rufiventris]